MPNLPDYSALLETAMTAENFAALKVAGAQAVVDLWAANDTPPALLAWLFANANTNAQIESALKEYLIFLVSSPTLLPYAGNLVQSSLAEMTGVITAMLKTFIAAETKARGGV